MPFYEYRTLSPGDQRELVAERLARGFPPHRPPHLDQGPGYYLLTAAVYEHRALIAPESRRLGFQQALLAAFDQPGITCCAWVVLPNHYHLLVRLPALAVVGPIFQRLHGRTARQWNLEDGAAGRTVWYHYSDRAIRSEDHFYCALNYLHANPVRHGFVERARDWRCSSLPAYLDVVGMDWLSEKWHRYPVGTFGDGWDGDGPVPPTRKS